MAQQLTGPAEQKQQQQQQMQEQQQQQQQQQLQQQLDLQKSSSRPALNLPPRGGSESCHFCHKVF